MVRAARTVVLAAWIGGSGAVASAQPAPQQEAAEHFKRAAAAEQAGRRQDAIDEYLLAYTLAPHADVLYNVGVNYEALEDWARAVEYYQRYLDEQASPPSDAATVAAKIRELRARIPAPVDPVRRSPDVTTSAPRRAATGTEPDVGTGRSVPVTPPLSRWHAGLSYGVGVGDAPVERYLAHAGMRFADRLDLDAILGGFGKNDHAFGVMGRLLFGRVLTVQPFVRGVVTVGYAKQDASSAAETRFPLGFEAGGGLQIGARGKLELDAVVRWTAGGWDAAATSADSYVNDEFAFAFDIGAVVDFAIISGVR